MVNRLETEALGASPSACEPTVRLSRLSSAILRQAAECTKSDTITYTPERGEEEGIGAVLDAFLAPRPWWHVKTTGNSQIVLRKADKKLIKYLQWWAKVQFPPKNSCSQRGMIVYNDLGRYWASLAHVTSMEFGMLEEGPCGSVQGNSPGRSSWLKPLPNSRCVSEDGSTPSCSCSE